MLESFKEGPLDTAQVLEVKLKYYEKARVENLSLILAERATAEQKLLEEQRKREEQELKLVTRTVVVRMPLLLVVQLSWVAVWW
jgi:hypothetical protein